MIILSATPPGPALKLWLQGWWRLSQRHASGVLRLGWCCIHHPRSDFPCWWYSNHQFIYIYMIYGIANMKRSCSICISWIISTCNIYLYSLSLFCLSLCLCLFVPSSQGSALRSRFMNPTVGGWWLSHPSGKWWSSSVGMMNFMNFPTEWTNKWKHVPNHQAVPIIPYSYKMCMFFSTYEIKFYCG